MRRIATIIGLAVGLSLAPSVSEAGTEEWDSARLVSAARQDEGLGGLRRADALDLIAERHAHRMLARGEIYHNPNLANELPRGFAGAGENVGVGSDAGNVHDAFMYSPSHRRNILGTWTEIGVGVAVHESGETYVVHVFVLRRARSNDGDRRAVDRTPPTEHAPRPTATDVSSHEPRPSRGSASAPRARRDERADTPRETSPRSNGRVNPSAPPKVRPEPPSPVSSRAVGLLLRVVSFSG